MEKLRKEEYEENLEKELKRRRMRMIRDVGVMLLSIFFAFYLLMSQERSTVNILLIVALFGYSVITIYGLRRKLNVYRSYFDELHIEDGNIVKFNPRMGKVVKKIPFENIITVYTNIDKMPYTLYVLYETKGKKNAESFYKTRIKDENKFEIVLKKKDLLHEESVDPDYLIDIIQGVKK